ncbi:multidrug effflux MFS transporter [Comamonadaceae bacterium G21597-S1]|nr:multidrug effflux MFS transporter [Comamonadaceae bacterium G21597-S1]
MGDATVVLILAALLGVQPLTTDLYLPALPALTEGFGAGMAQAQLTLSALLIAFGVSQLVWGSLSDRFGRRPVLLLGLGAYTLAAIGSALAPSMELLVMWRAVQGAAMGAGVTCARAIIRDLYHPADGARVMSKALSGLAVVAFLSPPVGGLMSDLFNWRAALAVLAVFGAASLVLVFLRFQESLPRKDPHALQPLALLRSWGRIARHPTFVAFSALSVASYAGLFTFLATSSFVFIQVLGLGKTSYGLLMASASLFFMTGTFVCRRLLHRYGIRRTVAIASGLTLCSGSAMGLFALAGWSAGPHGLWFIMLPMYVFMLAHGIHQPCGQSGAVGPFPQAAGAASALNGFLMMLAAFGVGGWLGQRMDGTVLPLTNGIWFWSAVIAGSGWLLVHRYGEPAHAAAGAR